MIVVGSKVDLYESYCPLLISTSINLTKLGWLTKLKKVIQMQYKRCHDHKWMRELIESVFLKFHFNQYQSIKVGGFEVTTFRTNEKIDFRLELVLKP